MQLPWRRGRLRPEQQHARAMIENGIAHGDPTQWGLFKEGAGYTSTELRRTFARYLRGLTNNPDLPDTNREKMLERAARLESEQ